MLILDEMNRADLSKVLGECFSLLEDRDTDVHLGGHDDEPRKVRLPPNLYVIGTMNLMEEDRWNTSILHYAGGSCGSSGDFRAKIF